MKYEWISKCHFFALSRYKYITNGQSTMIKKKKNEG